MIGEYIPLNAMTVMLALGSERVPVGRLARRDHRIYFAYDAAFAEGHLHLSPFRLPNVQGLQVFEPDLFDGLPGLFNDSLPDGWGRLLLDRALRSQAIAPDRLSPLDRLAHVGASGVGALVYIPDVREDLEHRAVALDLLADQAEVVVRGQSEELFAELLALGGSPQGARPKAMIGVNIDKSTVVHGAVDMPAGYAPWLVKFANVTDGEDAGAIEYVYSMKAREARLELPETHLFASGRGAGYFATRRFDRTESGGRLHTHTACGLLHADFRVPSLDYEDLIKATMILTRDVREAQKMYRLAVFNVLSHNRDDHAKNFSFLMDRNGFWTMAPAYDLTFSSGPGGEQSTLVMGEGKQPGPEHLMQLAAVAEISSTDAYRIIDETKTALARWKELAIACGVSRASIQRIGNAIGVSR